ncbi:hypothetical protein ACHAPI_010947 [Fusarium lateritium]
MNWSTESISEILSRNQKIKEHKATSSTKRKDQTPGTAEAVCVPLVDVLVSLGETMGQEVEELAFPYLLMHGMNWTIMEQLVESYDAALRNHFGPRYMSHEWEVPFMMGLVLSLAECEDEPAHVVFDIAGKAFDALGPVGYLDICTRQMHTLCRRDNDVPQEVVDMLKQMSIHHVLGEGSSLDDEDDNNDEFAD